jgi:hypothetical protein
MKVLKLVVPIVLALSLIILGFACWGDEQKYLNAADLLENPVYNEDIKVAGVISLLGELFCPCFHLSSGGKTLVVWYGLMFEDDGTQWDDVSVAGLSNGDSIIITGQLRQDSIYSSLNEFWAKEIIKKENDDVSGHVENSREALDAVLQYLSGQGITVLPDSSVDWQEEDITPENILGANTIRYTYNEWSITIQYPIVLPQNTIYQVEVVGPYTDGWYWKGSVSYSGQVAEQITFGKLTVEKSLGIARDFVIDSATFKFDGILDTLTLTDTITLHCPYCWQFIFEFDSRNSGYGDRTGQILLPIITHHQAVISIDHGQIVHALMDQQWNMLQQEQIN